MKQSRRISNQSSDSDDSSDNENNKNPKKIKFEDWMGSDEESGNDLKKAKE